MKKNKKGTITLYIYFFIIAVVIVIIAGVLAPIGVQFNTQMFLAGEQLLIDANESISNINNTEVRTELLASLDTAIDAGADNIEVHTAIFQYAWVIMIFLAGLITFLFSRRLVEYGGGGFV